ncbi:MAG: hypothetical protein KAI70_05380 [Candidatus Omnitrophica bacterium]|nr:hypothetical protein [Candidatus Omnitrophota bacterium]
MVENNGSTITPEKQLLKLIEDPSSNNLTKAKGKYKAKRFFSSNFFKSGLSFFGQKGGGVGRQAQEISINFQAINWILKVCIVAAFAYLVIDITSSVRNSSKTPKIFGAITKVQGGNAEVLEVTPGLNSLSYYLDKVTSRDVFKPYLEKKVEEEEVVVSEEKKTATKKWETFINGLELVGIAWSDNPDVIITNRTVNRTFFLNRGSMFMEATVKDVKKDSVIIEYEGEEIELK